MARSRSVVLTLALLAACTGSPPPAADAGSDAALDAPADASPIDAGPDAAPPPGPRWCGPCHVDAECGGGLCLSLGHGEFACGVTCATDDDCTAMGLDATCMLEAAGLPLQCRPRSGSCTTSAPGAACPAEGCSGTYDVCRTWDGAAVCTTRCNVDADCPVGMRRCEASIDGRFCRPDPAYGPEACAALVSSGALTGCASGTCASGHCYGEGPHAVCLPSGTAACAPMSAPDGTMPCTPDACGCVLDDPGSLFGTLLSSVSRSACDLHFDTGALDGFGRSLSRDRFRLDFTDRIRGYAPEVPRFGHEVAAALDATRSGGALVTGALTESASRADLHPSAPSPSTETDLVAALIALTTAAGGTPDPTGINSAVVSLSAAAKAALAPVVDATRRALLAREAALTGLDAGTRHDAYDLASATFLPAFGFLTPTGGTNQGLLLGDVDVAAMAQAALDLTASIEAMPRSALASATATLSIDTPAGAIVISGPGHDVHAERAALLVIDLGGDDTYVGTPGANASADNGVSVVIDLGGTDDYGYVAVPVASDTGPMGSHRLPSDGAGRAAATSTSGPFSQSRVSRQGAGRLGIGLLFDLGTEGDHYRALRMSQGYGALGVGVLYDDGGDDVYEGEAAVQGASAFGVGLLYDRAGDDHYVSYAFSQGFGYSRGVGVLYDGLGIDDYVADPTDVLYFSPQNPGGSNSSFSQGAGFGRRDDAGGIYMSGGLGVLRDASGNDRYTCGIFGQGTGYWFGTGLLLEGDGADHYDGWWYVMGSAAHFAVAALLDDGGADTYQVSNPGDPARNTSVAVGHDFSVGWLVDRAGDDVYHAPNLSLGAGNAGGYGFFVDASGNDTYTATSDFSFGNASVETPGDPLRSMTGTIGLFVDASGTDTYSRPTMAPIAENTHWTQALHPMMGEMGAGIDAASGVIGLGL
jgi:hypothetical protein